MSDKSIKKVRSQLNDDMINVAKNTAGTVLERENRLTELTDRAAALEQQASVFVSKSDHIKEKMKRKDQIWFWIFAGTFVICLAIIITFWFFM